MPSDDHGELEAAQLAEIDSDLAALSAHVDTWIKDRFLESESAASLNLEDIAGLIRWLEQWHTHFDSYVETAKSLGTAGRPALQARLAQVRSEIDTSIASFTQMAGTAAKDEEG